MIKLEIIVLTNNVVLPFHNLRYDYGLEFIDLNHLFATHSLAEHGLGFLIKVFEIEDKKNENNKHLLKKIIFDTGGPNQTFLHNLDVRAYTLYDVDYIVISHWHYDHIGGLYKILERIDKKIPIICHNDFKHERFFKRSREIKKEDLIGKARKEIIPLLSNSKLVNQEPIDITLVRSLKGQPIFSENSYEIFNQDELKITVSGEIPRIYQDEEFDNAIILQNDFLTVDKIKDDKSIIIELGNKTILLCGCCHSGLKNTLEYVKKLTSKRITHIIGGIHMANASEKRIHKTITYLKDFQDVETPLYLFPIHCSGEKIINEINNRKITSLKAFNSSVGTIFNLY